MENRYFCKTKGIQLFLHFATSKERDIINSRFSIKTQSFTFNNINKQSGYCSHMQFAISIPNQIEFIERVKELHPLDTYMANHIKELRNEYYASEEIKDHWKEEKFLYYLQHPLLRAYQECGVKLIQEKGSLGLFWEQRTGKTPTSIIATQHYDKIIISVPAGHQINWKREYENWTSRHDIVILNSGKPKERIKIYKNFKKAKTQILIGSTNTLANDVPFIIKKGNYTGATNPKKLWKGAKMDMIILDEAHFLRSLKTQKSLGTHYLRTLSKHALALTGTPATNNAGNVIPIMRFIEPKNRYTNSLLNFFYFESTFNPFSSWPIFEKIKRNREDEWVKLLSSVSYTLKLNEVSKWLPETIHQTYEIEMTPQQKKHFNYMLDTFRYIDKDKIIHRAENVLVQLLRLNQISIEPSILNLSGSGNKTAWLKDYMENNPNMKTIIWSTSTKYLKWLKKNVFMSALLFTGELSASQKQQVVDKFNNTAHKLMLMNIQAGSMGWTLPCDTMIFVNRDWNPTSNIQANKRGVQVVENTNKKPLLIIDLQSIGGLDKYVEMALKNKWSKTDIINNINNYVKELSK